MKKSELRNFMRCIDRDGVMLIFYNGKFYDDGVEIHSLLDEDLLNNGIEGKRCDIMEVYDRPHDFPNFTNPKSQVKLLWKREERKVIECIGFKWHVSEEWEMFKDIEPGQAITIEGDKLYMFIGIRDGRAFVFADSDNQVWGTTDSAICFRQNAKAKILEMVW